LLTAGSYTPKNPPTKVVKKDAATAESHAKDEKFLVACGSIPGV
jgi:hypothetical protein